MVASVMAIFLWRLRSWMNKFCFFLCSFLHSIEDQRARSLRQFKRQQLPTRSIHNATKEESWWWWSRRRRVVRGELSLFRPKEVAEREKNSIRFAIVSQSHVFTWEFFFFIWKTLSSRYIAC
jgi:hypothetical protein